MKESAQELARAYGWAMMKQDSCFSRVDEKLARQLLDLALDSGARLALEIRRQHGMVSAQELCCRLDIAVEQAKLVLPGRLIRAVYTNQPLEIKVNQDCLPVLAEQVGQLLEQQGQQAMASVTMAVAARADAEAVTMAAAAPAPAPAAPTPAASAPVPLEALIMEMILAHELFHYYERQDPARNPQTARELVQVQGQGLGKRQWQWLKRRIRLRSLSEVAAHSFAQCFLPLPFFPGQLDIHVPEEQVLEDFRRQPAML